MTDSVFVIQKKEPASSIPITYFCIRSGWIAFSADIYEAIRFSDEESAETTMSKLTHLSGCSLKVEEYCWPWPTE